MEIDKEKIEKFLTEGAEWFEKQHLPSAFPAFVAQIPDAITKLEKSITLQSESNSKLSKSITIATWILVGVAFLTLGWDVYKTFCIN